MIFKDFANLLFGSKSKLKAALYFLSGCGPVGERELSRVIGLSHVGVAKALKDMEAANFLRKSRIGNVNVWSLNEKSYAFLYATDLQKFAKLPPVLHLKRELEADFGKAYQCIKKVVLFGSIVEGVEKESSDIDIFILVDKEENKKIVLKKTLDVSEKYKDLYGNRVSPFILTEKEAKKKYGLMENIANGIMIR